MKMVFGRCARMLRLLEKPDVARLETWAEELEKTNSKTDKFNLGATTTTTKSFCLRSLGPDHMLDAEYAPNNVT
jgi:hypothetical protein